MEQPFAALDATKRETLQSERLWLRERRRMAAVLVTNDIDAVIVLVQRIVLLARGPGGSARL